MLKKIKGLRGHLRNKSVDVKYPSFLIKEPGYFINLPSLRDVTHLDIRYPLLEPFAFAHIKWDEKNKTLLYILEEPKLSPDEKKTLKA